jgi:outer membrane protein with beta-barrel domain
MELGSDHTPFHTKEIVMLRKSLYGTLAVSLLLVGASTAGAQIASPIRFNVHAGAAVPVGDLADGLTTGFQVGAGLELRPAFSPIGLRFDGDFGRMGFDGGGGNLTVWSVTGNGVLSPMASPLYFIGGIGFYSTDLNVDGGPDFSAETDFGFNLGAGLSIPLTGFSSFIEARWHHINTEGGSSQYVPIVFGIRF